MPYTVQKPDNFAEKSDNITKASNNDGIQKDPSTQKDNSAEGDKTPQKGKSAEEVRLLIACLRPESRPNGVIDYQKVAEECNIVGKDGDPSKGAAQKRASRLFKSHGLELSALNGKGASGGSAPGAPKTPRSKTLPKNKAKQKISDVLKTTKDINARDNEPARSETGEAPIKKRKRTDVKHAVEVEVEEKDFNDTNARDDKPQPAGSETEARR